MSVPTLKGIDVSANNFHPIDWQAVKNDGASFAFAKATEGVGWKDPHFDEDWAAIPQASLARGCYHFCRADLGNGPLQEASWFLHVVPHLQDYDIVALDVELGGAVDLSSWALAWLQDVEQALGVAPLLYCDADFAANVLTEPRLAKYSLWLAAYGGPCPARIGVWSEVTLWQHTDSAYYHGIQGQVDESVIARDVAGFRRLGKQPAPPPSPPPTSPTTHKYLVLVDMRLRSTPDPNSSFWPPQYCYRNAVLDGTGWTSGPWVQVIAGGRAGWLLAANLKQVA